MSILSGVKNFFGKLSKISTKSFLIIGAFFILGGAGAIVVAFLFGYGNNASHYQMPIYFFNASQGRLESENRPFPEGDRYEWLATVAKYLADNPKASALSSTFPSPEILEYISDMYMCEKYDDMLVVNFSDYRPEMSLIEESIFRSAFTLTMVGLPFVESVKFRTVDEYELLESIESAATIANDPIISPVMLSNAQFTLFVIDESMDGLITEVYDAVEIDALQRGFHSLQSLFEGPSTDGALSFIPAEGRVRAVTVDTEAGGIYVNLNGEFVSQFTGTQAQARLTIYSIVNTVVYNTPGSLRRVFFLIDSERVDSFQGVAEFNLPFLFNEDYIIGED